MISVGIEFNFSSEGQLYSLYHIYSNFVLKRFLKGENFPDIFFEHTLIFFFNFPEFENSRWPVDSVIYSASFNVKKSIVGQQLFQRQ